MDLIESIINPLAAFASGIVGNIVASDLYARMPRMCESIIRRAALRLREPARSRYLEEWLSDLSEREGGLLKLQHSFGVLRSARQMRKQAERVEVVVGIPFGRHVISTGFKANGLAARFVFWVFNGQRTRVNYPLKWVCGLYLTLKVIASARRLLSQDGFSQFCTASKEMLRLDTTVALKTGSLTIDLTQLCRISQTDPVKGQAAVADWVSRFKQAMSDLTCVTSEKPPTS